MIDVTYRFIAPKDITMSLLLQVETLLQQLGSIEKPLDEKHLQIVAQTPFLVAIYENTIIGCAILVPLMTLTRRRGIIEHVVVDEKFRRNGIGRKMIQRLIETAKDLKLSRLDLTSGPERYEANLLYGSLGFRIRQTRNFRLELM